MTILSQQRRIVDANGEMLQAFLIWTEQVTALDIITGTGSPEGVIEATISREYMDDAGTTGNIKYIKQKAEIGGDKTQGWILI